MREPGTGAVTGLREARPPEMLVLLDREPVKTFTSSKRTIDDEVLNEKALTARITDKAGPHNLGVTFVKEGSSLTDTPRQPTNPAITTGGIRARCLALTRFHHRTLRTAARRRRRAAGGCLYAGQRDETPLHKTKQWKKSAPATILSRL